MTKPLLPMLLLVFTLTSSLFSEEIIERVPKSYSLALGWEWAHKNAISPSEPHGFIAMFDYAWQVSGIDGSRVATYITIPLGYSYFPQDSSMGILSYGWTIRHDLLKKERNKPVMPFIAYGLLLNQLNYEGDEGKRFGHQTRFDAGAEFFVDKPWRLFTKLEWSMTRFPERTSSESDWVYRLGAKVGVRFCKPARKRNVIPETAEVEANSSVKR